MGYLSSAEIDELRHAAVDGDIFQFDRRLWLLHIRRSFVAARLPRDPVPLQQFLLDLAIMNDVERLDDGSIPLQQYLSNVGALLRTSGQPEAAVFDRLASQVGNQAQGIRLPASARSAPEVVRKEAIVHQDDTLSIGFLADALTVARSIARISVPRFDNGQQRMLPTGGPWIMKGTAWLIGPDLLMTNQHVINARDAREPDASAADLALQAGGATIEFDLDAERAPTKIFTVAKLEAADAHLDYALLRLTSNTGRPPLAVATDEVTMTASTYLPVNIIQHPRGLPKRIAFRNNLMSGADSDAIRYFTDTDFGSSGAPVCDDTWRVVALHRGAEQVQDVSFQGKKTAFVNFGTQMSRLLADLKQRLEPLHAEIVAGQRA